MRTVLSFNDDEEYAAKVATHSMELVSALEDIDDICRQVINGKRRIDANELADELKAIVITALEKL